MPPFYVLAIIARRCKRIRLATISNLQKEFGLWTHAKPHKQSVELLLHAIQFEKPINVKTIKQFKFAEIHLFIK